MTRGTRLRQGRLGRVLAAALVLGALAQVGQAQEPATAVFTDWTSYTATKADGTLQGAAMSLAGEIGPNTITGGTETNFNQPAFTPPLPTTDSLQLRSATAGNPYTFVFARPVTNPVIHVGDLSASLTFSGGVPIDRVSGDPGFTVAGSTVTGTAGANGTIRVRGTYTGLAFSATSDPSDVFYMQLGALPGAVAPPPPPPDFALQRAAGSTGRVYALPGTTVRVPVNVARNQTSSGRVNLASGKSAGITTRMEPTQVAGGGTSRANLAITLTKKAKPGKRVIVVTGTPADATVGPAPRTVSIPLTVQVQMAVNLEGMEVNQGVQRHEQAYGGNYSGVRLSNRKKTVVRVFADLTGSREPAGGRKKRPPFGVALNGYRNGKRLGTVMPTYSPKPLLLSRNDDGLSDAEHYSQTIPFSYVLPPSWTKGTIRLIAVAIGIQGKTNQEAVLCVSSTCGATPTRILNSVPFFDPPSASLRRLNALQLPVVHPYDKRYPFQGSITPVTAKPPQIFEKLVAAYPGEIYWLDRNDRGSLTPRFRGVEYANDTAITEAAESWDKRNRSPGDGTIGVYVQGDNPGYSPGRVGVASARTDSGVMWRPMTAVAHETFHIIGFRHASPACGSGGEAWPLPDGRMGGIGIDTSPGSGGGSGPFRIIADRPLAGSVKYDLMSYCGIQAGDPNHWISVYNWNRVMRRTDPVKLPAPSIARARAAQRGRAAAVDELAVTARASGSGVAVTAVERASTPAAAGDTSAYRLVGRNAAGQVQAVAATTAQRPESAAGSPSFTLLSGQLPRAGVTRVDVVDQTGQTVATRSTSGAPSARLTSPRKGSRTGKGSALSVRWSRGPNPGAFRADIEVSANGGRTYQSVYAGPNTGRASIPIAMVSASRNARVRLRVGDGFQEAVATSGRFRILPRKPSVQIIEPKRGQASDGGGGVRLFGSATDDRGRPITGRRLTWTAGRTVLGRGADIVSALPAGTRRVRLTASSGGRKGSASVAVRVRASTPLFTRLRAKRRGSTATLTVAANQPARLSVRGKRYRLTTRAKRIRVRVGRKKAVSLRLVLSAGGKRTTNIITVRR